MADAAVADAKFRAELQRVAAAIAHRRAVATVDVQHLAATPHRHVAAIAVVLLLAATVHQVAVATADVQLRAARRSEADC